jgi:hypothetical protein
VVDDHRLSPDKSTVSVIIPFLDEAHDAALLLDPPASSTTARLDGRDVPPVRDRAPLSLALPRSADSDFDPDRGGTQRTVGWVLGGTGLASIAVGTIFAVGASSTRSSLDSRCPNAVCGGRPVLAPTLPPFTGPSLAGNPGTRTPNTAHVPASCILLPSWTRVR